MLLAYLQAHWVEIMVSLLAIDQVLLGIFPQVAILGNIKDVLQKLLPKP